MNKKMTALMLSLILTSGSIPAWAAEELTFTADSLTGITDSVVLRFSEELDAETIDAVTLWQEGARVKADIYVKGNDVVVEPAYMTEDTVYTIDITSGLKNFDGTKSAAAQEVDFRTAELVPEAFGIDNLNNEEGDLYIGYIGGSITLGTGESENVQYADGSYGRARWATQLTKNYFEQKYPNKTVHEVNAGIGGTAADLGMFRVGKHIVEPTEGQGPDVVFVDVATNNEELISSNRVQEAKEATEEIIRQLARLPKQPVVIFVINPYKGTQSDVSKQSIAIVNELCDYYGIGVMEIQERFDEAVGGNEANYFADGVHPNSKGYTVYAEKLMELFEENEANYIKKLTWQSESLHGRNFGNPTLITANDPRVSYSGTWTEVSGISEYAFQDGLMQTTENGASLTLKFSGTTFGILSNCFDGAGVVDCTVDGKGLESWGSWVVNHRAGFSSLPMPTLLKINLEPGEHTAVIKKIEPSGYNNGAFQFGYFLVEEPLSEPLIKIGGDEPSGGDENEIIINSIYPKNKAENVSVLEDVTVELAEGSVASESDVQVLGNGIPDYNVEINGETINIEFTKELPYYTDITVKIGNNTNTFITERNPIKTLFYEDFEGNAGESLARFENVGQKDVYYCVYDNKLLMQTHETRQPDGGTPCIRNNENAILYIKGSENWSDYTLDLDVANGWYTKAGETGEYYDSEAMISVKTDKATGNGVSLVGRWVNPGRDAFFTIYPLENFTLTGSWHGGWNVFNSQYRTNHHMTIDATGKDVAFKFTGYGSDISNKWTDAVAEGAKGGVTLRSSWGRIVYDNILVTDKGLIFTPTTIKNVKDELVLSFTKTLDDSAAEYIRVLKDGVDQNVEVTLGDDAKKVYVNVSTLTPDERYTLSVGNGVMSTDGTNVSSEKNVQFTVSDDFGVLGYTPSEGEQNVDVFSDIQIQMSGTLSENNVRDYISVYGMTADKYDVKVREGRIIDVIFKDALPFDSDIKVTIKKGLAEASGKVLENDVKWTFHTQKDTTNILYYQDFENISASGSGIGISGNKFGGLTVQSVDNGTDHNSYTIENGALNMSLNYKYQGLDAGCLRFVVDGSENWTDYEISADFKQNVPDGEKWVWTGFGLRYNGENSNNSMKVYLNYLKNGGSDPRLSFKYIDGTGNSNRLGWDTCTLNTNEWYRLTAAVEGQKVTGKIEKDGEKIKEVSYDVAANTGNENALNSRGYTYISPFWYRSYVDNITVYDKGIKFTPSTTKFTDGKMTLDFDVPMNTENSPIVVFEDEAGNKVDVTAKWQGEKSISIDAKGLMDGVLYNVTLKKDGIESLDGTPLAADKSCRVIGDVPCYVENVEISDIVPGQAVTASADITDYGKNVYESYMLVLAVFDERGALYSIVTDTRKNMEENEKTSFSVTSAVMPENTDGYSAVCYIWDNMQNIQSISIPVKK